VAGVAVLYFGYWRAGMPEVLERPAAGFEAGEGAARKAADRIAGMVDSEQVRQTGTEIAGQVVKGAERAGVALEEARVTAKIKSKMALDDTLDSSGIDVDTSGTTVTVSGAVLTKVQHQRALQLARETAGVTEVVDKLGIAD
jgi:osmotically-inducible protein OsmY